MTNKGGIVVSAPSRSSTARSGFSATSVDAADGATGGPFRFCGAELRHTFVDLGMSPSARDTSSACGAEFVVPIPEVTVY
jgi:hypothetical protein